MIPSNRVFLERLLASLATIAASVGCTTGTAIPLAPLPAVGPAHAAPSTIDAALRPAHSAALPALGVASRQANADVPQACAIDGEPRIVATKAAPPSGVKADADESHVWLRFGKKANAHVVMALNPESLEVIEASDSPPPALEDANFVALHVFPVQSAWSKSASHDRTRWQTPKENCVVVGVDARRSVLAWTEGSLDTGMDVHVLTVGSDGQPLGAPVTLPHDGSAIGQPAVAVASSGRGVVAFIDSNGHGFDLVAASLDCTLPAPPDARPAWARK